MRPYKILPLLIISLFVAVSPSFAEKAEKLPGKIVFRTDRFEKQWSIATMVDGKVKKIWQEGGVNPKWSPDGAKLAIARHGQESASIIIIGSDGKKIESHPTEWGPFMLDWLPDGQTIIFSSDRKFGGKQETGNLFRYNLATKAITQFTSFNDGKGIGGFTVSPDGKKIIFRRSKFGEPEAQEFHLINTDGLGLEELKGIKPIDPNWSKDGKKIVYTSGHYKEGKLGYGVISIYDFESGEERIVLEARERGTVVSQPVFSPDGTQILFSRWSGLYVINTDGTGLKTVLSPKRFTTDESSSDLEPDWTA